MILRWLLFALVLSCRQVAAADPGLFASDQALEVTIAAPLSALLRDRARDRQYFPAQLRYIDENRSAHNLDIGVRPRGRTRLDPDTCQFPPLRLRFQADQIAGTVFEGQDELKLVTHCRSYSKDFQQYLLLEYLSYQTLNQLTEQSLRTRLLTVTYETTDKKQKPLTSFAFLIEDRDQMAARNGKTIRRPEYIQPDELDPGAANLFAVFQYLIGNTDWSMLGNYDEPCCHNVILIAAGDEPYIPVPFDFDFAGIVNAPYAAPGASTGLRYVRTRGYRGFCDHLDTMDATLIRFEHQKAAIYRLYRRQAGLAKKTRRKTLKYLDLFYRTIEDPDLVERRVVAACRYRGALSD